MRRHGTYAQRQEGSVLLLSLLVVLVLASLGLVMVQQVAMEIHNCGVYKVAKQRYYVGEAGLCGPIAKAAKDPVGFATLLEQNNNVLVTRNFEDPNKTDMRFFDLTGGSFGPEFTASESAALFVTTFTRMPDVYRPGNTQACDRRYVVISNGFLKRNGGDDEDLDPNWNSNIANPDWVVLNSQVRFATQLRLGPYPCGQ